MNCHDRVTERVVTLRNRQAGMQRSIGHMLDRTYADSGGRLLERRVAARARQVRLLAGLAPTRRHGGCAGAMETDRTPAWGGQTISEGFLVSGWGVRARAILQ